VPHISVANEVPTAEAPAPAAPGTWQKLKLPLIIAAAVVLLGGGYFVWRKMSTPPPPPVATKKPAATPKAGATATTTPGAASKTTPSAPTPSDTLNNLAHAPVNAINKAQAAVAKRDAAGQSKIDDITDDLANKPATPVPGSTADVPKTSTGVMTVAPGITATTEVTAQSEASAAFKSFVGSAKISGVFQGTPARAFINGRLFRAGEVVDGGLGITFDSIDAEKKLIIFKDKAGSAVSRRY
jgi:hypothetical protein